MGNSNFSLHYTDKNKFLFFNKMLNNHTIIIYINEQFMMYFFINIT